MGSHLLAILLLGVSDAVSETSGTPQSGNGLCASAASGPSCNVSVSEDVQDEVAAMQVLLERLDKAVTVEEPSKIAGNASAIVSLASWIPGWASFAAAYSELFNSRAAPVQPTSDALAFAFSIIGSCFMGSYPSALKAPSVLEANVHPIVFQCYKSFWVVLFGLVLAIFKVIHSQPYVFSYWGLLASFVWIPGSLLTIASVPRIGMGMSTVLMSGLNTILVFMIGQFNGELMKKHKFGSRDVEFAPFIVMCVVIGLAGVVLSQHLEFPERLHHKGIAEPPVVISGEHTGGEALRHIAQAFEQKKRRDDFIFGLCCAVSAACCGSLQYVAISTGKKVESANLPCIGCPAREQVDEAFNVFGSYFITFSIGTGIMTSVWLGLFASRQKCTGNEMPESHFGLLRIMGSIAGWLWLGGFLFHSAAINRGGASVMGPTNMALQFIISAAWSLLYYGEVQDPKRIVCWVLSVAWTVSFVVLLGREKQM